MIPRFLQFDRRFLLPVFLSGLMLSCSPPYPFGWAQDSLDIANLDQIANQRAVTVQGIVVNVAPFLEGGAYQIQDQTGRVWVKTDRPLPRKGTVLSVRGEVAFEPIFIGPEKLGESYLLEISSPRPQATASTGATTEPQPLAANGEAEENVEVVEALVNATEITTEVETNSATATPSTPPAEGAITVVEVEEETVTANGAATTAASPSGTSTAIPVSQPQPVANPDAPRPIANSVTGPTPAPNRVNVDDQFLPHKRFTK